MGNERTPLTASDETSTAWSTAAVRQAAMIMSTCTLYIVLSSCLINYNKFLMHPGRFPHAVPLTAFHMVVSFVLSGLGYVCFGKSAYPGMDVVKQNPRDFLQKLAPLSILFAVSICCSNQAYIYCSVPFLQMCKEMNVVMIYLAGLFLAVEKYNGQTLAILFLVMIGCWMSIHGEMNPSGVGFAIQMISQTSEVIKIIIQQMIMQGMRVDPLTMVMTMSPLCLCTLSVGLYFLWEPGTMADAHHMAYHLCINGLNAFALNVAVALVIRHASGVSFVLAGVIKDILIVTFAAIFTGALVTRLQVAGFTIAVMGVAAHSLVRSHQDFVDSVLLRLSLTKQAPSRDCEA
jgi:hypothetical protein